MLVSQVGIIFLFVCSLLYMKPKGRPHFLWCPNPKKRKTQVTNQGYFQPLTVAPRDPRQEERRLCQQASRRTEASSRERRT